MHSRSDKPVPNRLALKLYRAKSLEKVVLVLIARFPFCELRIASMSASFSEVTKRLLAGQSVTWQKFGDHKGGSIRLENH